MYEGGRMEVQREAIATNMRRARLWCLSEGGKRKGKWSKSQQLLSRAARALLLCACRLHVWVGERRVVLLILLLLRSTSSSSSGAGVEVSRFLVGIARSSIGSCYHWPGSGRSSSSAIDTTAREQCARAEKTRL